MMSLTPLERDAPDPPSNGRISVFSAEDDSRKDRVPYATRPSGRTPGLWRHRRKPSSFDPCDCSGSRVTLVKLFVGNLPWRVRDNDLVEMFSEHGQVTSANVVMDRDTGRSRGFGFVEMSDDDGRKAIEALNGSDLDGRAINVNEAHAKTR